ncbi:MAG: glycosyltransferase family 2 protein [Alistipes sp.]|jgi:glycosyltransferase involved in cell wall biosynthesis|nr:glycosyltransferase family 2 protein [Alistipes sp.]
MASGTISRPTLTVFTPTWNRAHTLGRLYESLAGQSSDDFRWLIIDDGSTDGTRALVEGWMDEGRVAIEYRWQSNLGMHGAHNTAYRMIDTELNVCIDSDDCMAPGAVAAIVDKWRRDGGPHYAGIVGLDATMEGKMIGTRLPDFSTTLYGFYKRGGRGDKKLIYRTDVITGVPEYPMFEGENYVGLGYKYLIVDLEYELLTLNEPLCMVDYRPDGSSMNMYRQYFRNPRGFAFIRRESMCYHPSHRRRFVEAVHYVASSIIARDRNFLAASPRIFLTLLAVPAGVALWGWLSFQYRRNKIMTPVAA